LRFEAQRPQAFLVEWSQVEPLDGPQKAARALYTPPADTVKRVTELTPTACLAAN